MSSYPPPPPPSGSEDPPRAAGPSEQYPGQQYPGQQYPGQQYPAQYGPGQQYPGQYGQQPGQYGQQPYPGQYGQQPYPGQYGQQYGQYGEQYPAAPGAGQYGPGPYGQQYPGPYGDAPGGGLPTGSADPLVSVSVSEWFSRIVEVVRRSWKPLAVIQLASGVIVSIAAVIVLLAVGASAVGSFDPTALAASLGTIVGAVILAFLVITVIAVVVYALSVGMSTYVAVRNAVGQPAPLGEAFAFARGRALPLIGWGLVVGLGFGVVVAVLVGLAAAVGSGALYFLVGLVLFVGYIYLGVVMLSTFTGVTVLERQGVGRMFALAHRNLAGIAGRVLLFLLIAVVYALIMSEIIRAIAGASVLSPLLSVILVQLPLGLAAFAVSLVTYAGLRHQENPAVGTPQLAAELTR